MNGWLYTTLASYVSRQKSKYGACFSPTAGNTVDFHCIDWLLSFLFRYSARFSSGVFENLSIKKIRKESSFILNAILQIFSFLKIKNVTTPPIQFPQQLLSEEEKHLPCSLRIVLWTSYPELNLFFLPNLNVAFCSSLRQLNSPLSPAPGFDNHILSDKEVSVR